MNDDIVEDRVKKKTLSLFLDETLNPIFTVLAKISKNVYNTTIYVSSIFYKYKEEIYRIAFENYLIYELSFKSKEKPSREDLEKFFYAELYKNFEYFFNLHSKENSVMKTNNNYLYRKIIEKIKLESLTNDNFNKIKFETIVENLNCVTQSNIYEYEFIIDQILISIYRKKFNLTSHEMCNKMPVTHKDFIQIVKDKKNMFPAKNSIKESLKYIINSEGKLLSDENIITRVIYKHLGDNKDKIPSDLICNIIKKAFGNFDSYWTCKSKGLKCSMAKFLKKDELFILPFFMRSFKIDKENLTIRLTVGKNIAKNYIEITNNKNLICLNENDETLYKKYIDKDHLKSNHKNVKLSKENNFIIDNNYIEKTNKNIIDSYYINLKLPKKIADKKIKLIEINPLYKGYRFKANIVYDTDEKIQNSKKEDKEKKLNLNPTEAISIDFGMKNLMTIYDPAGVQTIIKGNYLLSLNHYYNKEIDICNSEITKNENKDELQKLKYKLEIKRQNKISEHFNKIVKYLFEMYKDKKAMIIGYNMNWKENINLGKNTNRKFYGIPYKKLVEKLKEKFKEKIYLTEESYTSKCDSLNLEEIKRQDVYSGKRIKRGLFKSQKGIINADLNGAINIMRKKINLTEITGLNISNPFVVKIITPQKIKISRNVMETVELSNVNQRVKSKMVAQEVAMKL